MSTYGANSFRLFLERVDQIEATTRLEAHLKANIASAEAAFKNCQIADYAGRLYDEHLDFEKEASAFFDFTFIGFDPTDAKPLLANIKKVCFDKDMSACAMSSPKQQKGPKAVRDPAFYEARAARRKAKAERKAAEEAAERERAERRAAERAKAAERAAAKAAAAERAAARAERAAAEAAERAAAKAAARAASPAAPAGVQIFSVAVPKQSGASERLDDEVSLCMLHAAIDTLEECAEAERLWAEEQKAVASLQAEGKVQVFVDAGIAGLGTQLLVLHKSNTLRHVEDAIYAKTGVKPGSYYLHNCSKLMVSSDTVESFGLKFATMSARLNGGAAGGWKQMFGSDMPNFEVDEEAVAGMSLDHLQACLAKVPEQRAFVHRRAGERELAFPSDMIDACVDKQERVLEIEIAKRQASGAGSSTSAGSSSSAECEVYFVNNNPRSGIDWKRVDECPAGDPRRKMQQGPMFTKQEIEKLLRQKRGPDGRRLPPDHTLTEEEYQCIAASRPVDPTLSGLTEARDEYVVRYIARAVFLGRKQPDVIRPNNDGSIVSLIAPFLKIKPPQDPGKHLVIVIYGRAQGGKSQEAVWAVWLNFFQHACLSTYYVRNEGGLGDAQEIYRDFEDMNKEIERYCFQLKREQPAQFGHLTSEYIARFCMEPRSTSSTHPGYGLKVKLVPASDVHSSWNSGSEFCVQLERPQVMVSLGNKHHMDQILHSKLLQPVGDLSPNLSTKLSNGQYKQAIAQFDMVSLLCGKHSVRFNLETGRRKKKTDTITLHSGIPAYAWDMNSPYNAYTNAKRARYGRCTDEVDRTRSDRETGVQTRLHDDTVSASAFQNGLAAQHSKSLQEAKEQAAAAAQHLHAATVLAEEARRERDGAVSPSLQGGGPSYESGDVDAATRNQRAARRSRAAAAGLSDYSSESSDDETSVEDAESDLEVCESDLQVCESDADVDAEEADEDELLARQAELERQADEERERFEAAFKQAEKEKKRAEKAVHKATAKEDRAMAKGLGAFSITGHQSAAAINIGITATVYACMHKNKGNAGVCRLVKMEVPDAYNDMCCRDEHKTLRLLRDPERVAGPGDIEVIETPPRPINNPDMKASKTRNDFIDAYITQNSLIQLEADGTPMSKRNIDAEGQEHFDPVPQLPLRPRAGAKRCYRIEKKWWHPDHATDNVPWIKDMIQYFEKSKTVVPKRTANSWDRNGTMFELMARRMQLQREPLLRVRRVCQGLIITNETHAIGTKNKLIADLFVRGKHEDPGDPMYEASAYNFSCNGIDLYVNQEVEGLDADLIKDTLENPQKYVDDIIEYLKGDPTIDKTQHSDEMVRKNYVRPLLELAEMAQRVNENGTKIGKSKKKNNDTARGTIWSETKRYTSVSGVHNEIEHESATLTTFSFVGCKLPKYMATLFTVLDARRFVNNKEALPLPFIGMTKNIGGRAKRYMCHGYRSRIQVMCHTTDIFPNKRLGLSMQDALQEAFRLAGFDDVAGFGTVDTWMKHWVRQEYVTTPDFLPLIKNALGSHEEWVLLTQTESAPDEEPMDTLQRVLCSEMMKNMVLSKAIRDGHDADGQPVVLPPGCLPVPRDGREPTCGDMPPTRYHNLLLWMTGHVNRSTTPFLRYSTLDHAEKTIRASLDNTFCNAIVEEFSDEVAHDMEEANRDLDEDKKHTELDKFVLEAKKWEIPLPNYSSHHAAGGTLQQRDMAEMEATREMVAGLLRDRQQIETLYESIKDKKQAIERAKRLAAAAAERREAEDRALRAEMEAAGVPMSGEEYTVQEVRKYKASKRGGPSAPRAVADHNFNRIFGEETFALKLAAHEQVIRRGVPAGRGVRLGWAPCADPETHMKRFKQGLNHMYALKSHNNQVVESLDAVLDTSSKDEVKALLRSSVSRTNAGNGKEHERNVEYLSQEICVWQENASSIMPAYLAQKCVTGLDDFVEIATQAAANGGNYEEIHGVALSQFGTLASMAVRALLRTAQFGLVDMQMPPAMHVDDVIDHGDDRLEELLCSDGRNSRAFVLALKHTLDVYKGTHFRVDGARWRGDGPPSKRQRVESDGDMDELDSD